MNLTQYFMDSLDSRNCKANKVKLDLFLQASCKKKLHLPLLKNAFFKGGWGGGGGGGVLKWN